jgi:hypothetical protein
MVKEAHKRIGSYYYFYPIYAQAKKAIWNGMDRDGFPFLGHIPEELRASTNNQEMLIKLKCGSLIQMIGTDNIDAIMSTNPVGCVFSEYALQKPEAWDFVRPILRENGGWALFNFTPRGLNHGWSIYQTAKDNPEWFCELLTINDTGVLNDSDMEAEREDGMSENLIRQEYYCDFTASNENTLIPLDLVVAAAGKVIHPVDFTKSAKVMGVDVARFGDDTSVICKRQGLAVVGMRSWRNLDNMSLASLVAQEIKDWHPDAVFIDAGRGEGVIDRLRQLGFRVSEVNFGGRSTNDQKFVNKRTEMWFNCKEWLESGGAIPDDAGLRQELSLPTYEFDPRDRLKLMPKDKMKEELKCSPDKADALCLTFAEPVVAANDREFYQTVPQVAITDYNLFSGGSSGVAQTEYDLFGG